MSETSILQLKAHRIDLLCKVAHDDLDPADLIWASEELQSGKAVSLKTVVHLVQYSYKIVSSDAPYRDQEAVYYFIASILSSTKIDDKALEPVDHWKHLVEFAEEFDHNLWIDADF